MVDRQPRVSVCMPTYRGEAHIAAAIDSVFAQTFEDFELIVVDDNSSDATPDFISTYNDQRLRFFRNTANLGPQGNWNRALSYARGKYFKLMPQDDLLAPTCLADQASELESDTTQRVALVFGARDIIDANGRMVMRRKPFRNVRREIDANDLILACVRAGTNLIGEPGNVLMRTELARRIGPFNGSYGYVIDLDYWFRALRHGNALYLPQRMSSFRISAGSWSVAIGARQQGEFLGFLDQCQRDPEFPQIGRIDRWRGATMAWINASLRGLVYRWLLRP